MRIKQKEKLSRVLIVLFVLIFLAVSLFVLYGNKALTVNEIIFENKNIPKSFSGYRIVQISDLHNAQFGRDNCKLLKAVKDTEPNIIVITGDLVDSRRTNIEVAVSFVKKAKEIAPVYYVTGNHESRISDYNKLRSSLLEIGVNILENEEMLIEKNGQYISIIGVNDPDFTEGYFSGSELLNEKSDETFSVLLSHRPELFKTYVRSSVNLVFSGHAHGGQFRLPFIGGLYAPHQGFLPEYDSGVYIDGDTAMVVSRGLGNSVFPLRINNRPEIIVVELEN